jgi:hypothetical protein
MPSMIALTAKFASGNWVIDSPQPTTPSSVVIVEVVRLRVADGDGLDGLDPAH